jgi:hypothetical protein
MKRRPGRPPKPLHERRGHTLAFRINDETYQRLRASAEANGRSLSEEAEVLLSGAFDPRERLHEALMGMMARGEVVLSAGLGTALPRISATMLAEAVPGLRIETVEPVETEEHAETFRRLSELLAAALRGETVVAAAREMLKTAVGEVRKEVVAARDPGGGTASRKKATVGADSKPA